MVSHRLRRLPLLVACLMLVAISFIWAANAADAPVTVVMKNFNFTPMSLSVSAGTTVTFKNEDEEPHTVTSVTGLFRSGALDTNDTFKFKFDRPGTYKYTCSIHPRMVAEIVVK
jgi:plastocyanin